MTELSIRVARVWLDNDGLVVLDYLEGVTVEVSDVKEILAAEQALTRGAPIRQLARIDGIAGASSDARAYAAEDEYASAHAGIAIVTTKAVPRILGNFWMRVNKPPIPTRLFSSEDEARAWLHTQ